jgi:hypothetical protein
MRPPTFPVAPSKIAEYDSFACVAGPAGSEVLLSGDLFTSFLLSRLFYGIGRCGAEAVVLRTN